MEVEINGNTYRTGTLNVRQQFHIARRLAPILSRVAGAAGEMAAPQPTTALNGNGADTGGEPEESQSVVLQEADLQAFAAIADALAGMKDDDCDYVIDICMATVMRQQGDRFAHVWVRKQPMFADMGLPELLQLTGYVIQENIGSFLPTQVRNGLPALRTTPGTL